MQKQVKGKVKFLLNVKVKVFYFGYKRQQKEKSLLVLTQTMIPTMIPGQIYFDNKQQYKDKSVLMLSQIVFFMLFIYAVHVLFLAVSTDTALMQLSSYLTVFRFQCLEEF